MSHGAGLLRWEYLRRHLAKLDAEVADRRNWINNLAAKYGVVRLAESLTHEELAEQQDRVDRAMGAKFYTTTPPAGMRW
jgi:hypothetical protein